MSRPRPPNAAKGSGAEKRLVFLAGDRHDTPEDAGGGHEKERDSPGGEHAAPRSEAEADRLAARLERAVDGRKRREEFIALVLEVGRPAHIHAVEGDRPAAGHLQMSEPAQPISVAGRSRLDVNLGDVAPWHPPVVGGAIADGNPRLVDDDRARRGEQARPEAVEDRRHRPSDHAAGSAASRVRRRADCEAAIESVVTPANSGALGSAPSRLTIGAMEQFAALLDRLVLTPQRNGKLRLMVDYFRATPDPDRGYALAALTGELNLPNVKPAMLRGIIGERVDEVLFGYSYDYVGDLAETIALVWPKRGPGFSAVLEGEERIAGRSAPPRPGGERALSLGEARPSLEKEGEGAQPHKVRPKDPHPHRSANAARSDLSQPGRGESASDAGESAPSLAAVVEGLLAVVAERGAAAGRGLARHARRDRPLGPDQARHRRPPDRRLGAARQAGARRSRRQGGQRDRGGLARPRAALRRACSPGSRGAAKGRHRRSSRRSARSCSAMRSPTTSSP